MANNDRHPFASRSNLLTTGARRLLTGGLLAYVLFIGGIAVLQDHLLYFPERIALPALRAGVQAEGFRAWPDDGEFRGLVREPNGPAGPARATLVLFHGNAGHAGHRTFYATLARFGIRIVLAEYPAYGPRAGALGEASLVADAAQAVALAHRQFGDPIILAGESLGAGVAAAAFPRVADQVAAVWLVTPWDRLEHVARHHYPWLPVRWLLRDRYDSQAHLAGARVPVAIVVAQDDVVVPARFGEALHAQLSAPKRLWRIAGAGHNDWPISLDDGWWRELAHFLLQGRDAAHAPAGAAPSAAAPLR